MFLILVQAVKCQGLDLDSLLPDPEMLMKIMVHPLQIQVTPELGQGYNSNKCTAGFCYYLRKIEENQQLKVLGHYEAIWCVLALHIFKILLLSRF